MRGSWSVSLSAVATVAAVASLGVGTAAASLYLILRPTSGPPGIQVMGHTGGNGALPGATEPLATYFVSQANADGVSKPTDPALIRIGQLRVDGAGNGHIAFVVPEVAPGEYVVMASCPVCAPFSAGRTMLPIGAFRVTSPPPNTATGSGSPILDLRWLGLALILIAIAVVAHGSALIDRQRP